ncbi:hypothetical protein Tsubulata_014352 [Turnera subulata]|uniref:B-block binding subunit of TFIIIC domain-containing protein n=1 Tax=Turnera subulata TaxID=218843 RepID=A0A9Q0F4S8_9ROSI|nr:hypothetical protein Tsubulata_014352 [Turnera subulata]
MDALISSALEEICYRGPTGITLSSLWPTLTPPSPSPPAKSSLWSQLLQIPTLQFSLPNEDTPLSPADARIQLYEDAERIGLKIVAKEQLIDSFAGLYDIPNHGLSANQLRALRRLAVARGDGMTQNQLAKELGIENNNFFYVVKNLECLGLISKQPAVVKTKDNASVTTNLLYLHRFAKHLGVQQRLEIKKDEMEGTDAVGEASSGRKSSKDNVLVKDFLPAMKAICDQLEVAKDKVLVVSDIKQNLGYSGTKGHRAWRYICHRLKDAGLVEEFEAVVEEKVQRCLRLLKKFSPLTLDSRTRANADGCDEKEVMKFGRRIQGSEQLVELSLDQQIYDIIDAEGTQGTTYMEVVKRLGIDQKRSYSRIDNMVSRFGMHKQAENHLKTQAYRVWTSGNSNSSTPNAFLCNSKISQGENKISALNVGQNNFSDRSNEPLLLDYDRSQSRTNFAASRKSSDCDINKEISLVSCEDGKTNSKDLCTTNIPEFLDGPRGSASDVELEMVNEEMETNNSPLETGMSTWMTTPTSRSSKMRHNPLTTVESSLREQRILERLQEEKFILRAELHRWLMTLENKISMMDRKTVDRILNKLQQLGHCRCVHINVPVVTNCGRSRTTMVVLHPSIQNFPPELLGEIHDKLRSFEKQVRNHGSLKWKINESVPILNDVTRTQSRVISDEKAAKAEAMRTNGFVMAKMGRARLLHKFLWGHLSSSAACDATSSSGADSCTYKMFSMEVALKAIPVELFLQVAGSTQKYDDMIEKCKRGLCLADLPVEEFKSLMDTLATGRLSLVIDILRRLKLIRLIRDGNSEDGMKVPHATFTDAVELKPYIEEPVSIFAVSNVISLDLRPRIRHDFILSNKEAVDEYWKTLEYCFAAAHPRAAKHAFPGSAVPEVFHHRSWTSVRVMSADQRAELLKRVVKDDASKTLSYKDCDKIAKDLNLTLQQVLRVFYDKHHQRLKRFQGVDANKEEHQPPKKRRASTSKKREKSLEESSEKHARVEGVDQLGEEGISKPPDTIDPLELASNLASLGEPDDHFLEHQEDDEIETAQDPGQVGEECFSFVSQYAVSKMKPTRLSRFSWTDEADRQLVIQYVRHRAVLGPKVHRLDWSTIPDLPAAPRVCARRMASLNRKKSFRKALMKLCTMLSDRYAKHLVETQNVYSIDSDCIALVRCPESKGLGSKLSGDTEGFQEAVCEEDRWDDFSDKGISKAFEYVIYCKEMSKSKISKRVGSDREVWSTLDTNAEQYKYVEPELGSSEHMQDAGFGTRKDSARRSRHYQLHQKFIKVMNEGSGASRKVHKLLAVSNAVELLKLVFLSTSTAPELQNPLAHTLRRYSEYDLFAAFSYLRERKVMIGGSGDQPFVLSQQFLHSVSKSSFPANTGKRAVKFSNWLHEREKDLVEGRIDLSADLQCGDIFQLFALVSSGELSISPVMPDKGVGEAEDFRSMKRKAEDDDFGDDDKAKKLKSLADSELVSRREKGFPGIIVSVHRSTISAVDAVEMLKKGDIFGGGLDWNEQFNSHSDREVSCSTSDAKSPDFDGIVPAAVLSTKSPWEAMADYSERLLLKPSDPVEASLINPEMFRAVYTSIQKAGDQGLSIEEVSQCVGNNMHRHVVDVLQAFGRVMEVNAYESARVVDSLYRSKYFLSSLASFHQDPKEHPVSDRSADGHKIPQSENCGEASTSSQREVIKRDHDDVHRVTILNLPEEFVPLNEAQTSKEHESQEKSTDSEYVDKGETLKSSCEICMPILPWINGDGTINRPVYNGLVRRVLGTVMQNPGILEEEIIHRIDVLNPQSCRSLLELMILDKHLIVRKMCQSTSGVPPALLRTLLGSNFKEPKFEYREHFFANPMNASSL